MCLMESGIEDIYLGQDRRDAEILTWDAVALKKTNMDELTDVFEVLNCKLYTNAELQIIP